MITFINKYVFGVDHHSQAVSNLSLKIATQNGFITIDIHYQLKYNAKILAKRQFNFKARVLIKKSTMKYGNITVHNALKV